MLKMSLYESLILFCFMDHVYWSLGTKCSVDQITIIKNSSEHCLDCVECPVGTGSVPQCGSFLSKNTTVRCKKCDQGASYSETHDHTSCRPCRICVDNEEVIKKCTVSSDTQCGKCKPGYYRSFVFSCEKCSPCCQDTKEDDVELQCLRQGFTTKDRACRDTGRDCRLLKPTLANTFIYKRTTLVYKSTTTQGKVTKLPLTYLIGGIIVILVVVVFGLVVIFLARRIYCDAKQNRPEMSKLQGERYEYNNDGDMSSQVELGQSLVENTNV
ncbi:tumor necrosis factor receptor superfamily member 16-like [Dendronephthya gigantea]|uniref:tumor necrosis factor receptor superfamily member 16-like n=1 Tax=Dendronephthya gigantea TaxID=151771 RepID=UPI00106D848E|nr:tumor necrosis factor receptor superfamily member 16-like [Dendronephthya gigantea]